MALNTKLKLVKYEPRMAAIVDNAFFLYKKCLCNLKSLGNSPSYIWVRNKKSFSEYGEVSTTEYVYDGVIKPFVLYYKFHHIDQINNFIIFKE